MYDYKARFTNYICWLTVLSIGVLSCTQSEPVPEDVWFNKISSDSTGVAFENTVSPDQNFNIFNYRNFYNGGGVALGDINNDGLVDIYFTANQGANKLYVNEGDFQFRDVTGPAGVAGNKPWTTGVTMADVNGDGLLDIYVLNSADLQGGNRENELYINQGDLTFEEQAAQYNLDDNAFSVHASFFDYDGDGDLDCYLLNNRFTGTSANMKELLNQTREGVDPMGGDKLLRNDGGTFTDVSGQAGIYQGPIGFGLGVIVGDINGDYRPDIYVSNDFWERDYLYINQGDGTFSEELVNRTTHVSQSSMGSDIGDVNNDGRLDIFTTDMLPVDAARIKTMTVFEDYRYQNPQYHGSFHHQYVQNTLQVNNGNGTFTETGFLSGVAATDWSWGALMFDFNNNGWNDIFVSNGIYRDITDKDFRNFIQDKSNIARIVKEQGEFNILDFLERLPSQKIKNFGFLNNRDKTFSNETDSLGFYEPTFSNGAAYGDLDNDGDLDLVVNNLNNRASVYRNDAEQYHDNHFLKLEFEGASANQLGVGAHVKLYTNGQQQVAENIQSKSFQSSVPASLHFGLGSSPGVDSLMVIWPDQRRQVIRDVAADQTLTVDHSEADEPVNGPDPDRANNPEPVIADVTSEMISSNINHNENDYSDFSRNPMLPKMLSQRGPHIATGDLNNDGREDFIITGALDDPDKMFMQQANGRFKPMQNRELARDSVHESTALAIYDMDNDDINDLIIANGGNQFKLNSPHNQLRMYQNTGFGIMARNKYAAPEIRVDAGCIRPNDFDDDGDMDLFIGGRVVPESYGSSPRSYLLRNDGAGKWTDVTPDSLRNVGMVTDAAWTDRNGDGRDDLIVVGEWMPVTLFENTGRNLKFDSIIENSSGWWTAIEQADLDGDGDTDFVLGNWGQNSKFKASPGKPITMYVNDFNGDGNTRFIITTYQLGDQQAYPFHTYSDLISEMPFLQQRIPNHHTYAEMTYEEIFTGGEREGATRKEVQTLSSALLISDNENLELQNLPIEAQVSPIYGIVARDFNGDETVDLLLLGNQHGLKPEVGRLDGNFGVFLFNEGELNYRYVPYHQSNTFIRGEVRDATTITAGGEEYYLISRNNDELMIFKQ